MVPANQLSLYKYPGPALSVGKIRPETLLQIQTSAPPVTYIAPTALLTIWQPAHGDRICIYNIKESTASHQKKYPKAHERLRTLHTTKMGSAFSCFGGEKAADTKPVARNSKEEAASKSSTKPVQSSRSATSPGSGEAFISEADVAAQTRSNSAVPQNTISRQETAASNALPRRQYDIQVDADIPENFKL